MPKAAVDPLQIVVCHLVGPTGAGHESHHCVNLVVGPLTPQPPLVWQMKRERILLSAPCGIVLPWAAHLGDERLHEFPGALLPARRQQQREADEFGVHNTCRRAALSGGGASVRQPAAQDFDSTADQNA